MRTATVVFWLLATASLGCACSNARTGSLQTGTTAGSGDADATVADASGDVDGPETIGVDASLPDAALADAPLADVAIADVAPLDTNQGDAGDPVGCCAKDQDCGVGERCVGNGSGNSGVCKPVPAWGGCWDGNDCTPTQKCVGGAVCPCDADCDGPDTVGGCQGDDSGCCTGAGNCPKGAQCQAFSGIGWSTCVALPEPGRCWKNTDCPVGHPCKGAAVCPCGNDCDKGYAGPGVCTPPAGAGCTPIQPKWVAEICDAASLVVWTGSQCAATCPGCCGCEPFCDATFPSIAACQAACQ